MTAHRRAAERDPRWREQAACIGRSELFFPAEHERDIDRSFREARAKSVCRSCPALIPCRDWAREYREPFVAGGESAADRKRAGFAPPANGAHDIDDRAQRRRDAHRVLAALPLRTLEQLTALAGQNEPSKETRA